MRSPGLLGPGGLLGHRGARLPSLILAQDSRPAPPHQPKAASRCDDRDLAIAAVRLGMIGYGLTVFSGTRPSASRCG